MRPALGTSRALAMLEEHPARIVAALAGASAARLGAEPMLGTWTATDVLAHLRACADTFVDVVPRIVAAERPRLTVIGPRERIEATGYRRLAFSPSMRAFVRQRAKILAIMRALPANGALREAVIVERGRRRVRTVRDYVDWLARHEERHVEQFERFGRVTRGLRTRASSPGAAPASKTGRATKSATSRGASTRRT